MDKITARKILEAADATAEAIVTAQYGHLDILDKEHGAAYDRVLFALLAEKVGDMTLAEFLPLTW